ncbi:Lpg1974 family pore-forming outer membrane protein [Persicirhabdus sediminis]|uniref:Outer membrane protein beta-barrel domain-containing protein n=1 Tax=Persicirhabdus sediminis TaxID=454144 RepID=A0A8J7MEM7_9BACT|nr:Lpg1974 family pore-forming outer membrane protein [Persicirhabdus sediminis]MBK1792002.1 hypothetical protein [Persicirhabdus sediminis]
MMKKFLTLGAVAAMAVSANAGEVMPMATAPVADCPWGLGLEALYMKAHGVDGDYGAEQDYEFAWRADLSYKQAGNLGVRLTYFQFNGTDDFQSYSEFGGGEERAYADAKYADLEFFDNFELGAWQGEYSAGIRWGELDSYWNDRYSGYEDYTSSEFSGWGPTFGLELVRPIGNNFSVYAGVRASWIFGDNDRKGNYSEDDLIDPYLDEPYSVSSSESLFIAEGTLGLQYDYLAFRGCPSYVRLGAEAQNWSASGEDVSLFGGSLRFGFGF